MSLVVPFFRPQVANVGDSRAVCIDGSGGVGRWLFFMGEITPRKIGG